MRGESHNLGFFVAHDGVIYAKLNIPDSELTVQGIYRSTDGVSWTLVVAWNNVRALRIEQDTLYFGTGLEPSVALYSIDPKRTDRTLATQEPRHEDPLHPRSSSHHQPAMTQ